MKENLLYVTSSYPNDKGDTSFIQTEIKYLSKAFNRIVVFSHGKQNEKSVDVPDNVVVIFCKEVTKVSKIFVYFKKIFDCIFWREVVLLFKNRKKISCIKQALAYLVRAECERNQIKRIVQNYDIKVLYTFWYIYHTLSCYMAVKYSGMKFKTICSRAHRFDLYELKDNNNYQPYKLQMDSKIHRLFFISRDGLEYYKTTFARGSYDKYFLSYLGTENENMFHPHKYVDEIMLLSVSYIKQVKRLDVIIDALFECSRLGIKINWTHIGTGPEEEFIKSYACNKFKDAKSIRYNFLGFMENEKVLEFYKKGRVDLFINTSESEGLPVSIMEAMSYGVPVIATKVGGTSEIVDDDSGFLISSDNCLNDCVTALKKWSLMSLEEKQRKALLSYKKWNLKFNAKKNYNDFASNLKEL